MTMRPVWLISSYLGVTALARILTAIGRPRRSLGDLLHMVVDPTFHLLAWTSTAALLAPLAEYIVLRQPQLLGLNLAGAALMLLSGILANEANRALGAAFTPYVNGGATTKRIVTRGIYRYIRHPLYTAGFLLTGGAALMLCSRVAWALTALCWLAVIVRTLKEERLLKRNMDGYADYMRMTKRFVPGVF